MRLLVPCTFREPERQNAILTAAKAVWGSLSDVKLGVLSA